MEPRINCRLQDSSQVATQGFWCASIVGVQMWLQSQYEHLIQQLVGVSCNKSVSLATVPPRSTLPPFPRVEAATVPQSPHHSSG